MKQRLYTLPLLFLIFISLTSFIHPLKISASLIAYNPERKSITVESKVFIDDFLKCIGVNIDVNNITSDDKLVIEDYYGKNYIIKIDNKKIPLKYEASDVNVEFNVLTIKFKEHNLVVNKRDKLEIINSLLFNEFSFLQSNRMELRFPPFFDSAYVECTKVKDNFLHTFK